jgi:2-dehydropantoate 2-reductase
MGINGEKVKVQAPSLLNNRKNYTKKMNVAVIGLGPVGMILAVKLKQSGCVVSICDKDEFKIKKIREEGVILENVFESKTYFDNVYSSITEMAGQDLDYIVFSLKSYHTAAAAREAECLITDKLTVISAQNGIDIEQLLYPVFGEQKTLRLIINFAGNLIASNRVKVTFFTPPNYIGAVDESKGNDAEIFAWLLDSVGFTTKRVDPFDLQKYAWEKTILNASLSALCGVGRLTMAEAIADPETSELVEQIINEGIEVAEKEKIRFPDDFLRKCLAYLKKGGDHFPSLAVDMINNRPTEIDYLNGKFVEYGKKHYVKTSLNLAFTNMVKAMSNKNIISRIPGASGEFNKKIIAKGMVDSKKTPLFYKDKDSFLGVDLGSAYTKFTVIDENANPIFRYFLPTVSNERITLKNVIQAINAEFNVKFSCATGYGRKHFSDTDIVKTEINCGAAGVSRYFSGEKNIIDIGGEDIKVIQCDREDHVANFYMNDKCAAGTGSFLSEISEKAKINIPDMSNLAALSNYNKELNSFCTVFAKTEIMSWVFDGMSKQDISRGIYISVINRVAKMRMNAGIPIFMIGGVIAFHPYLGTMLGEKLNKEIKTIDEPQYVVALGAAILARQHWKIKPAVNAELAIAEE